MKSGLKIFVGKPEEVERLFAGWANDGTARAIVSIVPLTGLDAGKVGFMIIFNTPDPSAASRKIVPIAGVVN